MKNQKGIQLKKAYIEPNPDIPKNNKKIILSTLPIINRLFKIAIKTMKLTRIKPINPV